MGYKELTRKIKDGYNSLKKESIFKYFNITWNQKLGAAEILVENDAGFKAIIIGSTKKSNSRGRISRIY